MRLKRHTVGRLKKNVVASYDSTVPYPSDYFQERNGHS